MSKVSNTDKDLLTLIFLMLVEPATVRSSEHVPLLVL